MSDEDMAAALADKSNLGEYRGLPVMKTGIAIRKAGDGLSKAMGIDPQVLEPGDTVMVLIECVVEHHDYKRVDDMECYELKQVLVAGTATIVDDKTSERKLRTAANKVQKAVEEAKGITRLPGTEDATDGVDDDEEDADD